jgi:hypothetical protein
LFLQHLPQWKPNSCGFQIQIWTLFEFFLFKPYLPLIKDFQIFSTSESL